jgi:hypothetical protein
VASLVPEDGKSIGKLVGTCVEMLPQNKLFAGDSAAGILIAEVTHFMSPTEVQAFMRDAIQWLQPGGRLVLTAASVHMAGDFLKAGMVRRGGGSVEDMYAMLVADVPDHKVVDAAPGYLEVPSDSMWASRVPPFFYLASERELRAMARVAGFEVERTECFSSGKYPHLDLGKINMNGGETTLFVARKPE